MEEARAHSAPGAAPLGEPEADPVRELVHDPSGTAAFDRLAAVPEEELERRTLFRAGGRRVVCYDLAPRVLAELARHGVDVRVIPGEELIKGTGGPRCMTRPLYC